jgi:hypothetical protein
VQQHIHAVNEFVGTFGMPNLDKLALHLKNPEYKTDAKIDVVQAERNGETIPTHIHFENAAGDFENDYRFMNKAIIEEKLKLLSLKVQLECNFPTKHGNCTYEVDECSTQRRTYI